MNSTQLLHDARTAVEAIIAETQTMEALPPETLDWSSGKGKWSVNQVFDHLVIAGRHYFPLMETGIAEARMQGSTPKNTFRPGFMGNYMVNSMLPKAGKVKNPMPTFPSMDPAKKSAHDPDAIQQFLIQMAHFQDLISQAAAVDLEQVRVKSVVGNILRFKLGDAIRFMVAHTQRHLLQAQKVLKENPGQLLGVARDV